MNKPVANVLELEEVASLIAGYCRTLVSQGQRMKLGAVCAAGPGGS